MTILKFRKMNDIPFWKAISEGSDNVSTTVSERPKLGEAETRNETTTTRVQYIVYKYCILTSLTSPRDVRQLQRNVMCTLHYAVIALRRADLSVTSVYW